jgi:hypothetical protein
MRPRVEHAVIHDLDLDSSRSLIVVTIHLGRISMRVTIQGWQVYNHGGQVHSCWEPLEPLVTMLHYSELGY